MAVISSHHEFVASEKELLELIDKELKDSGFNELVVMAGHFMLFYDEQTQKLVSGIFQEHNDNVLKERIKQRVGIFPKYTWDLSLDIAKKYRESVGDVKFLMLINDWQYVPETGSASEHRTKYYDGLRRLPNTYRESLEIQGVFTEQDILPSRKHSLAFPETWLKYRFQKSAAKLVKQGKLEKRVLEDRPNQSEISFLDETGHYRTLISCGITGCAGEVTEMISEVYKAGKRLMLIFAPGECHAPVKSGIEIALSLYNLDGMKIIVADPGGSGELTPEEIYNKMVSFSVFRS